MIVFENDVVDFLLHPLAQDAFSYIRLRELLYDMRHEILPDQIEDVMQILLKCHEELDRLLEWKKRNIRKVYRSGKCIKYIRTYMGTNIPVYTFAGQSSQK